MAHILRGFVLLNALCVIIAVLSYCCRSWWIRMYLSSHRNTYDHLLPILHFGLEAAVFDGESDYIDTPMSKLRTVCQTTMKRNHSIIDIQQNLLQTAYPRTPSFVHQTILDCFQNECQSLNDSLIEYIRGSMDKLSIFLHSNCIPQQSQVAVDMHDKRKPGKLAIIGASSSGLIATLSAFHSGFALKDIVVVEKRASYLRDIWFDLYDEPFYRGKKLLTELFKFDTQHSEKHVERAPNMEIYVMRAQTLERFLAKIVYLIGIDVRYQHQLVDIVYTAKQQKYHLCIDQIRDNTSYELQFAYLIGSDGMKSTTRTLLNISYTPQTDIVYNHKLYGLTQALYELSLIVDFKADLSKKPDASNPQKDEHLCPSLELVNNDVIDPWSVHFEYDMIDAVFKRFYFQHCQLQILLNHNNDLLAMADQDDYVYSLILNVSNFYFKHKISGIEQLKRMMPNRSKFNIVRNEIYLIQSSLKRLDKTQQIVLFIGDAAMTAHYRLGIGINTILDGMDLYTAFFTNILHNADAFDFGLQAEMDARLKRKALFQTTVVFFESVCNFVVFFDFDKALDDNNMMLYYRDHTVYDYVEMRESDLRIQNCIQSVF